MVYRREDALNGFNETRKHKGWKDATKEQTQATTLFDW